MRKQIAYQFAALVLAVSTGPGPVRANDSAAELSIGGLQFLRSNTIAIESEDLRISLDRVQVRYQFVNTSDKPVTLTVAFPLPDIDLSEERVSHCPRAIRSISSTSQPRSTELRPNSSSINVRR